MRISVTVKPNAREEKILKISDDQFLVMLKKSPKRGRANTRLQKLLSRYFQRNVRIIRGITSRYKIIEVS